MRILLSTLFVFAFAQAGPTEGSSPQKLKWLFAHGVEDPEVLALVDKYSKQISAASNGQLDISVAHLDSQTYDSYSGWILRWNAAFYKIMNGEADIVQVATDQLVSLDPKFEVFELPMLFEDYGHVEKVLDGPIGAEMLKSVKTASNGKLRAFAFTYSGGFRVVATEKKIESADDFKKMTMMKELPRGHSDNIRTQTFKTLGTKLIDTHVEPGEVAMYLRRRIDALQTPYKDLLSFSNRAKLKPKYVAENRINLFTTVVLMNEKAYQKLTKSNKKLLDSELNKLAREERAVFVKDNLKAKKELMKRGVQVISLNDTEKAKVRKMSEPVYQKFYAHPGTRDLVRRIEKSRQPNISSR